MSFEFSRRMLLLVFILASLFCGICAAEETRTFVDDAGREVILPVNITAVSPSGPLAQIVLYSVDPDLFVSISGKFSDSQLKYIDPRVAALPVTGQFYGAKSTMNPEEIMEMNKDLGIDVVLDLGQSKNGIKEDLDKIQGQTGVTFAFVTQNNLSDIPRSYKVLGELLSREEQGEKLSNYTADLLEEFDKGMNKVGDNRKSIIYVTKVDGNSVNLIGKGSYHSEVIDYLSDNLGPESVASSGYGDEYTLEDIFKTDPDYVIVSYSQDHEYYNTIINSSDWQSLRAVRDGDVYEAPYGPYSWMGGPPSVNRLLSMIWLGNMFYPDVFDYDVGERVKEYYSLFYHYDLTDDELSDLMIYAEPFGSGANSSVAQTAVSTSPAPESTEQTSPTKSPAPVFGIIAGIFVAFAVFRHNR
ncbi:iron complex transport system substrate-binding protein [Methanomicrobium sp. W14]|uniref:ABC transporter substrate-binding protein n=1 Tax=Methanomicrobium sp. W14 TaxID=2817839 RepID=UPI001AE8CB2C|nr:ABC transporter substrate-binding protein [Methanomicrobium sp. W14]MBP2134037.1 iron complex transport system substrate-binding protein [Methanomicrobium sp. W14]